CRDQNPWQPFDPGLIQEWVHAGARTALSACFAIWVNRRADKAVRAPFLNPPCLRNPKQPKTKWQSVSTRGSVFGDWLSVIGHSPKAHVHQLFQDAVN